MKWDSRAPCIDPLTFHNRLHTNGYEIVGLFSPFYLPLVREIFDFRRGGLSKMWLFCHRVEIFGLCFCLFASDIVENGPALPRKNKDILSFCHPIILSVIAMLGHTTILESTLQKDIWNALNRFSEFRKRASNNEVITPFYFTRLNRQFITCFSKGLYSWYSGWHLMLLRLNKS